MILLIFVIILPLLHCSPVEDSDKLPHSRDYYAGYIKAITDNFDKLFVGERRTRSTSEDEKDILMKELLAKGTQRAEVERSSDVKRYDGSEVLTEMKRDLSNEETEPSKHFMKHKIIVNREYRNKISRHGKLANTAPITSSKIQNSNLVKEEYNKPENKTSQISSSANLNSSVKTNSNSLTQKQSKETDTNLSSPSAKARNTSSNLSASSSTLPLHKKHHKTAAHKKRIISNYIEPDYTEEDARRNYILEHATMGDLPFYKTPFKNYVESNNPTGLPNEYEAQMGDDRSSYERPFSGQYNNDQYNQFPTQFIPPNANQESFQDSYGESNGAGRGPYPGGVTPDMQFGGEFNHNAFGGQQRMRNNAFLPTMSQEDKSVYENAQHTNSMFPTDNDNMAQAQQPLAMTQPLTLPQGMVPPQGMLQPQGMMPAQVNFMNQRPPFMTMPNNFNFNNNFAQQEAESNRVAMGNPHAMFLPSAETPETEENEQESEQEPETEAGETRSSIKKANKKPKEKQPKQKQKKQHNKHKHKPLKRCDLFGAKRPSAIIDRVLMPTCNQEGSCTLVPVQHDPCQNNIPLAPNTPNFPIGQNAQNFPMGPNAQGRPVQLQQTQFIPVLMPAPVERPFPIPAYNLPHMARIGNTACKDCIYQPARPRFMIIPLFNGPIFNGPPCNADLLSPYLG